MIIDATDRIRHLVTETLEAIVPASDAVEIAVSIFSVETAAETDEVCEDCSEPVVEISWTPTLALYLSLRCPEREGLLLKATAMAPLDDANDDVIVETVRTAWSEISFNRQAISLRDLDEAVDD